MSEYIIAIFSIRTSTMQFNSLLSKSGIKSIVIETPRQDSASCGISVRFSARDLDVARQILKSSGIKNFVRFYLVNNFYGRATLSPIE